MIRLTLGLLLTLMATVVYANDFEITGRVGFEARWFSEDAPYDGQFNSTGLSLFAEPELYWEWNNGDDGIVFKPFARVDEHDGRRTHSDIRELLWTHVEDDWELKAGIGRVFWGVTEFQHLADVINQTDAIEDVDGEDKLGQPLVNLSLVRDWGILDLFVLPGFRERTFTGRQSRLRGSVVVDDRALYESSAEQRHVDTAIRWSHTLDDYDLGFYWFRGTNREPEIVYVDGHARPFYEQMNQWGLDLQATKGDWLWKLETIYRNSNSSEHFALQGGFEYTLVGIGDSAMDFGVLVEYGWDSRDHDPSSGIQNDLFGGIRLTLNDMQSTEFLAGFSQDLDGSGYSGVVEASRRLGERWKLSADVRIYNNRNFDDPASILREDDHLQITLERYF